MNRWTMVIWGTMIFILWGVILFIAYKEQDRDYIKLTADLKEVTQRYINKNKIDLGYNDSYKVYINELKESNYIMDDSKIEEYCIDSIVITKGLIKDSFVFNKECKDEE